MLRLLIKVSMKSGLEGRNNYEKELDRLYDKLTSQ